MKHATPSKTKLVPASLLAAALIGLLLAGCSLGADLEKSRAVADQFLKALKEGQYQSAAQLLLVDGKPVEPRSLQELWQAIQQSQGAMQSWRELRSLSAAGGPNPVRHTQLEYLIQYANRANKARLTLEPWGDTCRITAFEFEQPAPTPELQAPNP